MEIHLIYKPNEEFVKVSKNEYPTLRNLDDFPSKDDIRRWKYQNYINPQTQCKKPLSEVESTSDITKVTCLECIEAYKKQKIVAKKYGVSKGNY